MPQIARFLSEVLDRAGGKQADIARTLGLPPSRVSEIYAGNRQLKLDEAIKLSEAYSVPITAVGVSASALEEVFQVALTGAPPQWTASAIRRLAEEVSFGLRLRQSYPPTPESLDRPQAGAPDIDERSPSRRG